MACARLWVQFLTLEEKKGKGEEMKSIFPDAVIRMDGMSAARRHTGRKTAI